MARGIGLVAALALMVACPTLASAADAQWPNIPGDPGYVPGKVTPVPPAPQWPVLPKQRDVSSITGEFGMRYWYSQGKIQTNLYGFTRDDLVSRLSYNDLSGHAGEMFGRVTHVSGWFLKGYAGIGIMPNGSLVDEDFNLPMPPFGAPYSSTNSNQREGTLAYASMDFGYNVVRNRDFRLGVFAGYHYLAEKVSAYGCAQTAGNPNICAPAIPDSILVISQNNHWQSLRLGAEAELRFNDRWSLRLDAAWLPTVRFNGTDFHWLRIGNNPGDFTGGVPDDGYGSGYQLEAALSYAYNENVNFGFGARYWRMNIEGNAHFENHIVGGGGSPQPVDWKTERLGFFVQASFKFGPYVTGKWY